MSNTPTPAKLLRIKKRPPCHPRKRKPPIPPKITIHLTKEGRFTVNIFAATTGMDVSPCGDLFQLVDFMGDLDVLVECDGIQINPTMILKIYCKLDGIQAKAARRNAALSAARANSPILS